MHDAMKHGMSGGKAEAGVSKAEAVGFAAGCSLCCEALHAAGISWPSWYSSCRGCATTTATL
jgi:hypothetical protein